MNQEQATKNYASHVVRKIEKDKQAADGLKKVAKNLRQLLKSL